MNPEIAALAVHDLKNALAGLESLLLRLEQAPAAATARHARQACTRLRLELTTFLTLYRDPQMRARVEDESPATLLRSLAGPDPGGDEPACRVIAADSPTCPSFWFYDPRLVRMALEAAIHNASRAGATQVLLDARVEEAWMVLGVEDDGAGLDRVPAAHDPWATGLGTELCRAVARAHASAGRQGRVVLESRPAGGTRFELWLP